MKSNTNVVRILILLCIVFGGFAAYTNARTPRIVSAVGDLNIIWGVPDGNPVFLVTGMLPGDTQSRQITVENNSTADRPVAIRGTQNSGTPGFSGVLEITVYENGIDIYGGTGGTKTLADFFAESENPEGIPLFSVQSLSSRVITVRIHMPPGTGNDFQEAEINFDITFGINAGIPDECKHITFSGDPMYGTGQDDTLSGTRGNDLIYALEGNDTISGAGGDDCIIGGPGNDTISGGLGNDVVDAGDGIDTVSAGIGNDVVMGGGGNDTLSGGIGSDTMTGGDGDDDMDGGIGSDSLMGDSGADTLKGGIGNDVLTGGQGIDQAHGGLGTDTCEAETETSCEL